MQPIVYTHTDPSAPALAGTNGSLNALLQACLVTGYGTKPAAGWTRPYYDAPSNTAVFRAPAGLRHYLQINDNAPGAALAREARARGYVAMTAYNTGTEPFPTTAQLTAGIIIRKSSTASTVVRNWTLIADDQTFYLFIDPADTTPLYQPYGFGDFDSWRANDLYASFIGGRLTENSTSYAAATNPFGYTAGPGVSLVTVYAPRSYSGAGTAVGLHTHTDYSHTRLTTSATIGSAGDAYPNPVDGSLTLDPLQLSDSGAFRGRLRGVWNPAHPRPLSHADTFQALDGALMRSFTAHAVGTTGQFIIETSDTWSNP